MKRYFYQLLTSLFGLGFLAVLNGCAGGGFASTNDGIMGNENGSQPVNQKEAVEYKKAVLRCYKSGGSRVVKIEGKLRCY